MKGQKLFPRRKGQTMVEFALVLPILLLVVLGLLEAGRLIFIYGSVVTASRQAVRYGSATGFNENGNRKYLDCDGIRAAATDIGFISLIDPVEIFYTREAVDGSISTVADCQDDTSDPPPNPGLIVNGDRIEVSTTSAYAPAVPLVPFDGFDITTSSKRTIFIGIVIMSTPGEGAPNPRISYSVEVYESDGTTPKTGYTGPGDELVIKYTITNDGEVDLTDYAVTDPLFGAAYTVCTGPTFSQGTSLVCTSPVYTVQVDDENIDGTDGSFNAISYGSADYASGSLVRNDDISLPYVEVPELELTSIEADPDYTTDIDPPGTITFRYTLTNTGNVELNTFSIASTNLTLDFSDCSALGPLAQDASATCTSTYTINPADINADGVITHSATIQGTYDFSPVISNAAEGIVNTQPLSLIFNSVIPNPYYELNGYITYSYQLTNNTEVDFTTPTLTLDITDPDGVIIESPVISCDVGATLPAETPTLCTGYYTIQQTDLDAGSIILTNPVGSAIEDGTTLEAITLTEVIVVADPEPLISTDVAVATGGGTALNDGDAIPSGTIELVYTHSLTNDGNITILAGTTYEIKEGDTVICTHELLNDLTPLATTLPADDCAWTYTITADDLAIGSIIKSFTAEITSLPWVDITLSAVSDPAVTSTIYTFDGPRLNLDISATVDGSTLLTDGEALPQFTYITYTYTFTNTGNEALVAPFAVTDYWGALDCSTEISDLAPQESDTCSRIVEANTLGVLTNTISGTATSSVDGSSVPSETPDPSISLNIQTCNLTGSWTTTGNITEHTWTVSNPSGVDAILDQINIVFASQEILNTLTVNGSSIGTAELPSGTPVSIIGLTNDLSASNNTFVLTFAERAQTPTSISISFSDAVCSTTTLTTVP